jgi:hypothetical protein
LRRRRRPPPSPAPCRWGPDWYASGYTTVSRA